MLTISVLFLIFVILAVGFGRGQLAADRASRIPRRYKLSTSIILVIVALIQVRIGGNSAVNNVALAIGLGMVCGSLGDFILAKIIPVREPRLVWGMVAFGVGHLLYIWSFFQVTEALRLPHPLSNPMLWGGYILITVVLWRRLVYHPLQPMALNWGALVYSLLLTVMAAAATGLASHANAFIGTATGGLLFLLSDLVLGNREFRNNRWLLVDDVVWGLYIAGQTLLVMTTSVMVGLGY